MNELVNYDISMCSFGCVFVAVTEKQKWGLRMRGNALSLLSSTDMLHRSYVSVIDTWERTQSLQSL